MPSFFRPSSRRPTWWSVYSRKPAYTSIWRRRTGLSASGMSSQAGISAWRAVSWQSSGTTPSFFCRAMVSSRSLSQPWSNLPLYLSAHSFGHMVRRVGRAGREIDEERLVRRQRLLLRYPGHGLVGHVLHEVIALFGRLLGFDRRGAFVQRRVPLVRLAADEPVEILEAAAARRPCVERPDRAGFPHRHFVTLAELRRGVAVELQRSRQAAIWYWAARNCIPARRWRFR